MAIPENKKRIMLTIPKNYEYLIQKCKKYTFGESMSTSNLFIFLVIDYLHMQEYLDYESYSQLYDEAFLVRQKNDK